MGRLAQLGLRLLARSPPPVATADEPPSFLEVYDAHLPFVWRTMRRLGVADADLDDSVQDVFVVVHRKLALFRPEAPIKHWLYRIASRVARDHRRSRARKDPRHHHFIPVADPDTVADGQATDAFEAAERTAASELIRELLQELHEMKREVFILADLEQMTAPEIAEVLQIPLNTVYSRLRAARREFELALASWQRAHDAHETATQGRMSS